MKICKIVVNDQAALLVSGDHIIGSPYKSINRAFLEACRLNYSTAQRAMANDPTYNGRRIEKLAWEFTPHERSEHYFFELLTTLANMAFGRGWQPFRMPADDDAQEWIEAMLNGQLAFRLMFASIFYPTPRKRCALKASKINAKISRGLRKMEHRVGRKLGFTTPLGGVIGVRGWDSCPSNMDKLNDPD